MQKILVCVALAMAAIAVKAADVDHVELSQEFTCRVSSDRQIDSLVDGAVVTCAAPAGTINRNEPVRIMGNKQGSVVAWYAVFYSDGFYAPLGDALHPVMTSPLESRQPYMTLQVHVSRPWKAEKIKYPDINISGKSSS